jgi:hypothetical protein
MQIEQVISILDSVASGIDPTTGQAIPHDLFRSPDVIPAFATAANMLRTGGTRRPRPQAAGARWTDEEDARLATEFDGGAPVAEIARLHGRTAGAINSRLVKLGKVDPDTVNVRERVREAAAGKSVSN